LLVLLQIAHVFLLPNKEDDRLADGNNPEPA
jgi:hypothetical protein